MEEFEDAHADDDIFTETVHHNRLKLLSKIYFKNLLTCFNLINVFITFPVEDKIEGNLSLI